MKILFLWHDLPSPYTGSSLPAFNLLKRLCSKHAIALLSFREMTKESRYDQDLSQFCEFIDLVDIKIPRSLSRQALRTIINTLCMNNLTSNNRSFFNFYSFPEMREKLNNLLSIMNFDVIYCSAPMAHFVSNTDLPKVVHSYDCVTEIYRQAYLSKGRSFQGAFGWLQYQKIKRYEGSLFKKFDCCLVASSHEKTSVLSLFPDVNLKVLPNGVDSVYFTPLPNSEEPFTLTFIGDMGYQPNNDAMIYFCSCIYGKIKRALPQTKLYIVGRNPGKEIQEFASDESIIITGFVPDVRPFLSCASVVIAPFISGTTGIKNKVLEAMAMAKPVVSTSMGIQGINASPNKNIFVADDPNGFAEKIVELLSNPPLRKQAGYIARKLVEENYSWQRMAILLDTIFAEAVEQHKSRL